MNGTRLYAPVGALKGQPRVRHMIGMPPASNGEPLDSRERLPWPNVVTIEESPDGIFLIRIADDGSVAGDTWHQSFEEAKEQAEYEFGEALGAWREIPVNAKDASAYALAQSKSTR